MGSIFKYAPPERAVDYFQIGRVAFSPPSRFNDPFELRPRIAPVSDRRYVRRQAHRFNREMLAACPPHISRKELKRLLRDNKAEAIQFVIKDREKLAAELYEGLPKELEKHWGVACFSSPHDNLLMWAHYAGSHQGFVLEFETEHAEFKALGDLKRVVYSNDRPVYDPPKGASHDLFLVKSPEWSYENEWRIFRSLRNCDEHIVNGKRIYSTALSLACVKAVYLGCRIDQALTEQIKQWLKGTRVTLYAGAINDKAFKVDFTQINVPT
jgi:hypothetical protein